MTDQLFNMISVGLNSLLENFYNQEIIINKNMIYVQISSTQSCSYKILIINEKVLVLCEK